MTAHIQAPNYTQLPNAVLGDVAKGGVVLPGLMASMGEAELKVTLALARLTIGFHRDDTRTPLSRLMQITGMSRQGVLIGIEQAEERGTIEVLRDGGVNEYRLLVYELDQVVNNVDQQLVNNVDQSVYNVDQAGLQRRPPSNKETINTHHKDTGEKETTPAQNPRRALAADLEPDGDDAVYLFSKLAEERERKELSPVRRWGTMAQRQRFEQAVKRLNGRTKEAIDVALSKEIVDLPRMVAFLYEYRLDMRPRRGEKPKGEEAEAEHHRRIMSSVEEYGLLT